MVSSTIEMDLEELYATLERLRVEHTDDLRHLGVAAADPICCSCAVMRLQRTEGPIRAHQHVDGAILPN